MKKRILSTLLAGLLLAPAFVSCINDDSKEFGSVPMAQIQLQSELQEQYDKEKMETLSLTAPDITQAPLQKDVSYTWEIGSKVVSTDKKLDYVCEDYGTFPGRLTIKNADNTVYRQFTVKVHFPYEEGVYALATRDGKTVVTYVSERFKGEKVVYDAFGAENLEVSFPLGKEPTAFYYLNTRHFTEGKVSKEASLFYIATKNPNKFYRVQADSMIVKKSFNEVSYGSPVTAVIDDWKADTEFQHGSGYVLIKQGNLIWAANYESQDIGNFGVGQQHLAGTEIDDKLLVTATQTLYNRDGVVVFDKKKGALFGFNVFRKFSYYNELGDYDYLGSFASGPGRWKVVSVFQKKDLSECKYYYFDPGANNKVDFTPALENVAIPGLKERPVLAVARNTEFLFYAVGKQIFAHYVPVAKFPEQNTPLLTLDKEGSIVSLTLSPDGYKLIVGMETPGAEKPGSIFVYDISHIERPALLYKAENCTGSIKQVAYRPLD